MKLLQGLDSSTSFLSISSPNSSEVSQSTFPAEAKGSQTGAYKHPRLWARYSTWCLPAVSEGRCTHTVFREGLKVGWWGGLFAAQRSSKDWVYFQFIFNFQALLIEFTLLKTFSLMKLWSNVKIHLTPCFSKSLQPDPCLCLRMVWSSCQRSDYILWSHPGFSYCGIFHF